MPIQTSYDRDPRIGLDGQVADMNRVRDILSRTISDANGIKPGRPVLRAGSDDLVKNPPALDAADADAFIATIASAATPQTLNGEELDGVIGGDAMDYGRRVSLILSNHANWDATAATLVGIDADTGEIVSESLAIPDGGNATVTSTRYYSRVISLTIPAQSGTSGTATLGTATGARLAKNAFQGLSVLETTREVAAFENQETIGVMRLGRLYVSPEGTVADGDRVYMRVVATGDEELGALRADTDGGDAIPLPAFFRRTTSSAGEITIVELFD